MGQCTSRVEHNGEIYNKQKKHESVFRAGVRLKGIEFSGIIGLTSTTDSAYTPVHPSNRLRAGPLTEPNTQDTTNEPV